MRLSHSPARTSAVFDDPNLVSHGGLVPVMALAERAGLPELLAEHVRPGGECGVNAHLKVGCLVAGMTAGADSIDDMGLLRHGAMGALSGGIRAPVHARLAPALLCLGERPAAGEDGPGAAGPALARLGHREPLIHRTAHPLIVYEFDTARRPGPPTRTRLGYLWQGRRRPGDTAGYHPVRREFSLTEGAARGTRGRLGSRGRDQRGLVAGT